MSAISRKKSVIFLSAALILGATACAPPAPVVTVTVGIWQGNSAEDSLYEDISAAFNRRYPQYELQFSPYVYDPSTIVAKYTSGQLPAVFLSDAVYIKDAYRNGFVKDAAPYMNEYGWTDKADEDFLTEIAIGKVVCGLPAGQYAAGMVLNLPVLARAGVIEGDGNGGYVLTDGEGNAAYPSTFSQVEEAARRAAAILPEGVYPLFVPSGDGQSGRIFADMVYNFGCAGMEIEEEGEWKLSLPADGSFGEAMRWVRSMTLNGFIDNSAALSAEEWAASMAEGTAIAFCPSDLVAAGLAVEPDLADGIAFVPMPSADGVSGSLLCGGTVYALGATATDAQTRGALLFLDFIGCGPDTDGDAANAAETKYKYYAEAGIPVFPAVPVWDDEQYTSMLYGLYDKYSSVDTGRVVPFFSRYDERSRTGEPYARVQLYELVDELFRNMIFKATSSDMVLLLDEAEKSFAERYLGKQPKYPA